MEASGRADFTVDVGYDREADVWIVEQSEVPGLTVEGDTCDQLITKIRDVTPTLLRVNEVERPSEEVTLDIRYRAYLRTG